MLGFILCPCRPGAEAALAARQADVLPAFSRGVWRRGAATFRIGPEGFDPPDDFAPDLIFAHTVVRSLGQVSAGSVADLAAKTSALVGPVSWDAIQGFLSATGLRLPTEAEWEYACRAGTTTPFHSGPGFPNGTTNDNLVSQIAWFNCNGGCNTWTVGGKAANALGVHDMLGNVWEWCNDWYGDYSPSPQTNPAGPASGSYRVLRGGSWFNVSSYVRSSSRYDFTPVSTYTYVGFRVARAPQ